MQPVERGQNGQQQKAATPPVEEMQLVEPVPELHASPPPQAPPSDGTIVIILNPSLSSTRSSEAADELFPPDLVLGELVDLMDPGELVDLMDPGEEAMLRKICSPIPMMNGVSLPCESCLEREMKLNLPTASSDLPIASSSKRMRGLLNSSDMMHTRCSKYLEEHGCECFEKFLRKNRKRGLDEHFRPIASSSSGRASKRRRARVTSDTLMTSDYISLEENRPTIPQGVVDASRMEAIPITPERDNPTAGIKVAPISEHDDPTTGRDIAPISNSFSFTGLNHIVLRVENLERSLHFYCGLLGMRSHVHRTELPFRAAWLFLGNERIHLREVPREVPNPDPVNGRPVHGDFERRACINCRDVEALGMTLHNADIPFHWGLAMPSRLTRDPVTGIPYQPSMLEAVELPSLFTRDPDGNGVEFIEVEELQQLSNEEPIPVTFATSERGASNMNTESDTVSDSDATQTNGESSIAQLDMIK